jgi:hypothetical protein
MTELLSPAAKAVFSAWQGASDGHYSDGEWIPHPFDALLAAVLRAAADQVVPVESHPKESQFWDDEAEQEWQNNRHVRLQFLAIAAELEASND